MTGRPPRGLRLVSKRLPIIVSGGVTPLTFELGRRFMVGAWL